MKRIPAVLLLLSFLAAVSSGCVKSAPESAALPDPETATYAVLVGTTSEKIVDERYPKATKLPFDSVNDAVLALLSDKADYVVTAYTNCVGFLEANPGKLYLLPDKLTDEGCGIAVNKGETALLDGINGVLAQFQADGTLERIVANWIREDGSAYVEDEIPVRADGAVLRVAVSAEREPMCFMEDGNITGLDAELIRRIAYALDMRVEFSDMNFAAMIPSVLSGKTPVAISNISATDERRESVNFSSVYFTNPQMFLTRAEFAPAQTETTGYTKLSDLSGKRIGVATGSIFDQIALDTWPDAKLLYYENQADQIIALQQHKIDAFLNDEPVARETARNTPGLIMLDERLMEDKYGFAFQKSSEGEALRDAFNAFMKTAEDGKLLEELDTVWFGTDEGKKTVDAADTLPATNGVVRFASSMESAPFDYLKDGQPVGTELDLITRFCKEMGYGLEITTASFGALLPGLVSGRYDAVAASISITEERAKSVHFSDPFYYGGAVAVVLDGNAASADASLVPVETARIGAVTGSTCEALALERYPSAAYASYTGVSDMMIALKSGKLDYCVAAEIDAINYKRSDQGYCIVPGILKAGACSIAVAKGNEALVAGIDALLDQYEADGTLARLKEHWVRPDGSAYVVDEIPVHTDGPTLRVAVCSGNEPSCFVMNGETAGLDVELMRRLAYDLGYQLTFVDMDFSALITALASGRADVAIANMAATEERAEKVDFTRKYYDEPLILVRYETESAENADFFTELSSSFRKNFLVEDRWKMIVSGIGITLLLSVCSGIVGILIGFGFCLLRMSKVSALRGAVSAVTRVLQGTPMVVLLMIFYYVIFNKTGLDGVAVSVIAFGLNFGAYASEIMLSGINAVDGGQREAAAAIGFTPVKTFLKIVFPQAARHFLPVLKGEYISLVKMTSIVGYVAVQDLTKVSDIIRSRTYEAFFPLIVTAVIYFLLSFGLSSLLRLVERRIDPKRRPRTLKGVNLR